jgi:DNA transformation protein
MSASGFVEHCLELLSPLGSTSARRMFGGYGLYVEGLFIALIIRDVLYLKVDDAHRAAFEKAHCKPFTYAGRGDEIHSLSYYTAPEEAMESPAEMTPWSRRALAAAVSARARAPARKPAAKKTVAAAKKAAPAPTASKKPVATKKTAASTRTRAAKP